MMLVAAALLAACVTPPPDLASFPPRSGAVWSEDCCGDPVVQKDPVFPAAVSRGTEGWVIVSGILDGRGWVTEPIVLASEPEGVFDAAALAAFDDWRYSAPRSDSGAKREVRAILRFHQERPHSPAAPSMSSGGGGGGGGTGY